ncbi:MAG TPA: PGDYG domain-containing protein [Steroidobacteraceae bacterium]
MQFEAPDLRQDPDAAGYIKSETVRVAFARTSGSIASREGPNNYRPGDALVTGSNGDEWSVSRERFEVRYEPLPPLRHGDDGQYRNKAVPILAKQINEEFTVRRAAGGDTLHGSAGDWLIQYAPGDWGIVQNRKFLKVYRPAGAA